MKPAETEPAETALDLIGRHLPEFTRREWGALAIAAARRAGLEEPDVRELQGHLEDQWAVDEQQPAAVPDAAATHGPRSEAR